MKKTRVEDPMVEKVKDEAKGILIEISRIKKAYKDKIETRFKRVLNNLKTAIQFIIQIMPIVAVVLVIYDVRMGYLGANPSDARIAISIALISMYITLLGSIYLPLMKLLYIPKEYTYSYRVKNKQRVNELIVAIKDTKGKGINVIVLKINTIHNGQDMYLEIIYK